MTGSVFLTYALPLVVSVLVAATTGGLTAWWFLHRRQAPSEPTAPTPESADTEFVEAEIDLASVQWAEANKSATRGGGPHGRPTQELDRDRS